MYLTVLYLRYMCEVDVNLQFIEICLFVSTVLYLTVLYRYMICLQRYMCEVDVNLQFIEICLFVRVRV